MGWSSKPPRQINPHLTAPQPLSINEAEFLTAAATCLDPGGRLYLECRSINDPLARQGEGLSPIERIAGHYRRFLVLDQLRARLEQANFQVLSAQEGTGFAPFRNEDPVVIRIEAMRP